MARPTSQRTVVSRLFAHSPRPIYVLDAERQLIYCNEGLAAWVKRPIAQLLGLQCDHRIVDTDGLDELARQLSPPPQTVDESFYRSSLAVHVDGSISRRMASFYLLSDDVDTSCTLVMVDSLEAEASVQDAFDADALHQQLIAMRRSWSRTYCIDAIVGTSLAMQQVRRQILLASASPCHVVIAGQPGSGREQVARTIHQQRTNGEASLVPLSCHLLDDELIEVALQSFQYEWEESADHLPSLLLLEVDQLPVDAQSRLVAYLDAADTEIVTLATARRPLSQLNSPSKFRQDLVHRLASLEISIPRLSERLEDVPLLAQWFVERANRSAGQPVGGFTPEAMANLLAYRWPGEVAELENLVEQAVQASAGMLIDVPDLPRILSLAAAADVVPPLVEESVNLDQFLAEIESELISRAIQQAKGNKAQAARLLHVSRTKLLRRIEHLGIDV